MSTKLNFEFFVKLEKDLSKFVKKTTDITSMKGQNKRFSGLDNVRFICNSESWGIEMTVAKMEEKCL